MIELTPDVRREFERLHKRLNEIEENFGHDWNAMADLMHGGLVSPRQVHERAMELWVNEGAPGDELPEGRHYRRALAELEGEG